MSDALNMHQAAAETGLAYDTFRKRWRRLAAELGFPQPLHGRSWSAEAVSAWKAERSAGVATLGLLEPDAPPERAIVKRAVHARAQLRQLRAA